MSRFVSLILIYFLALECLASEVWVIDEELSARVVFNFVPEANGSHGRVIISIPILEGFYPEKCDFEVELFEEPLMLAVYKAQGGFECSLSYEGMNDENHTVKIYYKGTNKIAVGKYTHNNTLKHRSGLRPPLDAQSSASFVHLLRKLLHKSSSTLCAV